MQDQEGVCFAFGRYHKFLSRNEARQAAPEERISSIWPFVVKQTLHFVGTLHQRELANFDCDDVLLEVWIELRQKDCKWQPEIGTYVAFAGKIIHNLFLRLRERSRTVESPRNTTSRLHESLESLSPVRLKSLHDIQRTITGTAHLGMLVPPHQGTEDPEADCLSRETIRTEDDALRQGLSRLNPLAASVLGRLHGLWDRPAETVAQIAPDLGKSPEQVRRIRDDAYLAIRDYLEGEFHPAASG